MAIYRCRSTFWYCKVFKGTIVILKKNESRLNFGKTNRKLNMFKVQGAVDHWLGGREGGRFCSPFRPQPLEP